MYHSMCVCACAAENETDVEKEWDTIKYEMIN